MEINDNLLSVTPEEKRFLALALRLTVTAQNMPLAFGVRSSMERMLSRLDIDLSTNTVVPDSTELSKDIRNATPAQVAEAEYYDEYTKTHGFTPDWRDVKEQ